MTEIWRPVKDYEGLYEVSNWGNVASLNYRHTGEKRCLSPGKCGKGYLFVVLLTREKKRKYLKVHRLVAFAFPEICGEWFPGAQVNHLNEDKTDNRAENLRWTAPKENSNWGTRNERVGTAHTKPVYQYTVSGEFVRRWESSGTAANELGCSRSGIVGCCLGKLTIFKKFIWTYEKRPE